jgi:DNA (cytosine-5)-methyltransferase 1
MRSPLRVLELYCGIGGCAAAVGHCAQIVAAVDISRKTLGVYTHNFPHPTCARTLESLPAETWREWEADLWWMSPPCQPYTSRGPRRDVLDPRAASFLVVLERLAELRPPLVALENVPGFYQSQVHGRLREVLAATGYTVYECQLCPTELGVPNRRRRYYLVASRCGDLDFGSLPRQPGRQAPSLWPARTMIGHPHETKRLAFTVPQILEPDPSPALRVSDEVLRQYAGALHIVDATDDRAECSCFTAGYGRSWVRSGSYLRTAEGVRRFSPAEILRLLGFPAGFRLPDYLSPRHAWPLVGNSLSVPAVQAVLAPLFAVR